jgi:hypothetical protein
MKSGRWPSPEPASTIVLMAYSRFGVGIARRAAVGGRGSPRVIASAPESDAGDPLREVEQRKTAPDTFGTFLTPLALF